MITKYLVKGEYQDEKEVPDPFHGGPENFERVGFLPCLAIVLLLCCCLLRNGAKLCTLHCKLCCTFTRFSPQSEIVHLHGTSLALQQQCSFSASQQCAAKHCDEADTVCSQQTENAA